MTRKLDRLQPANAPGLPRGIYTNQQRVCEQIEAAFVDQDAINAELASQLAQILAAQAAAAAAQTTANTANTTATAVLRDDAITSSYTSPGTVLSAADVGANATITIDNHVRKYGDATSLSVTGGTITGRAYSTLYYIYYNDSTRADTTPSYLSTTNANTALPNAATGRHFVGSITTPAAAAPPTSGGNNPPTGGGTISAPEVVP